MYPYLESQLHCFLSLIFLKSLRLSLLNGYKMGESDRRDLVYKAYQKLIKGKRLRSRCEMGKKGGI